MLLGPFRSPCPTAGAARANDTSVAAISLIGLIFPGSCRHGFRARCGRGDAGHDARVVERGVKAAELGNGAVHHRGHLGVVAHVAPDGDGLMAGSVAKLEAV